MLLLSVPARADKQKHPLDGSFLSVRIVGGMTPYRLVSYEVLWRARIAVAGHYRGLVNYSEALHNMSLVPTDEYEALFDALEKSGIFELKDAPAPPSPIGAVTFEIEARRGEKKVLATVSSPETQPDPRYSKVIEQLRAFVVKNTGDLVFRNVFFEPGTFGYVNLTSVPPSKIFLDGRDIKEETPLYGYEVPAGEHEVRLVAVKEGWERKHTLRVEPGMTTIVHFDLR